MFEQSVKLSWLIIIFYFISKFLLYAPLSPNREPKTSAFRSVFVFRAVFSPSIVVSVEKGHTCATNTSHYIAIFARLKLVYLTPFRWRIWLALSEFLCLLTNQNIKFVILFCTNIYITFSIPAPCYQKTAFLLANHNQEFFSCILNVHKQLLKCIYRT